MPRRGIRGGDSQRFGARPGGVAGRLRDEVYDRARRVYTPKTRLVLYHTRFYGVLQATKPEHLLSTGTPALGSAILPIFASAGFAVASDAESIGEGRWLS